MAQCKATRDDGSRCRAAALAGGDYCFAHDPSRRASFLNASRRGGRQRALNLSAQDEASIGRQLLDPVLWGEHYLCNRDG